MVIVQFGDPLKFHLALDKKFNLSDTLVYDQIPAKLLAADANTPN